MQSRSQLEEFIGAIVAPSHCHTLHYGQWQSLLVANAFAWLALDARAHQNRLNALFSYTHFLLYFYVLFQIKINHQYSDQPKGGYYHQPERHLQPIAAVCERCKQQQSYTNSVSWAAPGLSHWGTPPRLAATQQRSFRGPFHPNGDYF